MSPYFLALSEAREKVLKLMLELGANPLSYFYCNEEFNPITTILAYWKKRPELETQIRKCLNHFLAAGAGVDITLLPNDLFEFYNLQDKKDSLGPLLVLGQQKQPNGIWRNRLITRMSDMQNYLNDPNWHFKDKQLAFAVSYPNLKAAHIKDLQKLFSANIFSFVNDEIKLKELTVEEVKHLTPNQLIKLVKSYWNEFLKQSKEFKIALIPTYSQEEDFLKTLQIMQDYFKVLSEMMIFLNHPNVLEFNVDIIANLPTLLENEFTFLRKLHLSIDQLYLTRFTNIFNKHLVVLIKKHRKILSCPDYLETYYTLMLSQITNAFILTKITTENSLTLYWALKVNQLIDDIRDYHLESWKEPKLNALFALAMAYVSQGWNKEAYDLLKKAFKLLNFTYNSIYIVECIDNMISFLGASLLHSEETLLVLTQCCRILEVYQNEIKRILKPQNTVEVSTGVDIILLKAKETLIKKQVQYFINGPLLGELNQLGVQFQEIQDPDILFILDPNLISLDNEIIKFSLNTLPSSIKYDRSSKKLLFKLDFMPMRNIAWLKNFKNLLIEIKHSTEQKALIQEFSNLMMSPTTTFEPKIRIKTRPLQTTCEGVSESEFESKSEREEENYGFKLVPGYSPPVPISCRNNYIPKETLFIFIPINDPTFLPFLNLIRDKESGKYHGIYSVDPKGHNQPGVKFSKGMEIARLKVMGANGKGKLRAIGRIFQEYKTPDGRTCKLYGMQEVVTKKNEKHKHSLN